MAKYTIELRKICDIFTREIVESWFSSYNLEDYLNPSQIQAVQSSSLFSKQKLAKKIVDYYYMSEINFETPALFAHYAKIKMDLIMETKLPLIYSNTIDYDILENVNFVETFNRSASSTLDNKGNSSSSSDNSATGLNIASNTPQGKINKADILNRKLRFFY